MINDTPLIIGDTHLMFEHILLVIGDTSREPGGLGLKENSILGTKSLMIITMLKIIIMIESMNEETINSFFKFLTSINLFYYSFNSISSELNLNGKIFFSIPSLSSSDSCSMILSKVISRT